MAHGLDKKITCAHVRILAEDVGYDWAILIAGRKGQTQFTTWGKSPENKVYAAGLSQFIGEELCGPPREVFESFSLEAAQNKAKLEELQDAIRKHRDQRGDDRCWKDNEELYALLPEGFERTNLALHTPEEMLPNCRRFLETCQPEGVEYVSPQREIERLQAEVAALKEALASGTRPPG